MPRITDFLYLADTGFGLSGCTVMTVGITMLLLLQGQSDTVPLDNLLIK